MDDIWQEGIDTSTLETLTDEMVERAEETLQVQLPSPYISILKQQNGGYIQYNAHSTNQPTTWASDHIRVDHLYGIGFVKEKGKLRWIN